MPAAGLDPGDAVAGGADGVSFPPMHHPLARAGLLLLPLAGISAQTTRPALPALAAPFRVEAGGKPIEVEVGHAAPFVLHLDGDGLPDLAVGQFGGGTCRLYRNVGTKGAPRFESFTWLQSEGKDAAMESA